MINRLYYKSDFKSEVTLPTTVVSKPFRFTYTTSGARSLELKRFVAFRDDTGHCENCTVVPREVMQPDGSMITEERVVVNFDNHGLRPGTLRTERKYFLADEGFTLEGFNPAKLRELDLELTTHADDTLDLMLIEQEPKDEELLMVLRGKSAYEVAVANGFVGTEQEWLEAGFGVDVMKQANEIAATNVENVMRAGMQAKDNALTEIEGTTELATLSVINTANEAKKDINQTAESATEEIEHTKESAIETIQQNSEAILQARDDAQTAAANAATSASEASTSATEAETSASESASSATAASESANAASVSATSASESAEAAAGSKQSASEILVTIQSEHASIDATIEEVSKQGETAVLAAVNAKVDQNTAGINDLAQKTDEKIGELEDSINGSNNVIFDSDLNNVPSQNTFYDCVMQKDGSYTLRYRVNSSDITKIALIGADGNKVPFTVDGTTAADDIYTSRIIGANIANYLVVPSGAVSKIRFYEDSSWTVASNKHLTVLDNQKEYKEGLIKDVSVLIEKTTNIENYVENAKKYSVPTFATELFNGLFVYLDTEDADVVKISTLGYNDASGRLYVQITKTGNSGTSYYNPVILERPKTDLISSTDKIQFDVSDVKGCRIVGVLNLTKYRGTDISIGVTVYPYPYKESLAISKIPSLESDVTKIEDTILDNDGVLFDQDTNKNNATSRTADYPIKLKNGRKYYIEFSANSASYESLYLLNSSGEHAYFDYEDNGVISETVTFTKINVTGAPYTKTIAVTPKEDITALSFYITNTTYIPTKKHTKVTDKSAIHRGFESVAKDVEVLDKFDLLPKTDNEIFPLMTSGFGYIIPRWGFIGASYDSGEVEDRRPGATQVYIDRYERSWGQIFCKMNYTEGYNFSRGGQTAKGWCVGDDAAEGYPERHLRAWEYAQTHIKDGYTIQLGSNDMTSGSYPVGNADTDIDFSNYNNNADTYAGWISGVIQRVKSIAPDAPIFVLSISNRITEDGYNVQEWNAVLKNVVERCKAQFGKVYYLEQFGKIDWTNATIKSRYLYGGHPTEAGHYYLATVFNRLIHNAIRDNISDFRTWHLHDIDKYK